MNPLLVQSEEILKFFLTNRKDREQKSPSHLVLGVGVIVFPRGWAMGVRGLVDSMGTDMEFSMGY